MKGIITWSGGEHCSAEHELPQCHLIRQGSFREAAEMEVERWYGVLKRNCWRHVMAFGIRYRRAAGLSNLASPLIVKSSRHINMHECQLVGEGLAIDIEVRDCNCSGLGSRRIPRSKSLNFKFRSMSKSRRISPWISPIRSRTVAARHSCLIQRRISWRAN